jgi:hypothetical protein
MSGAAAWLAPAKRNEARARDCRWTLRAGSAPKKHHEAVRGLAYLLTGGALISVNLLPVDPIGGQGGVRLALDLTPYAAVGRVVSSCQVLNRCGISCR